MLHCSKILPIMLKALCLISHVLLINLQLWAHSKWLKHIFALQNACDRKDRYTLLELLTALLEYIDLFIKDL